MQLEVAAGVTLHVEELGAGTKASELGEAAPSNELGVGAPIVMLHGLLVGNMATWYFTVAPMLAKKHRVVLFDLRGHGTSSRPKTGYDVETMSRDLEVIVERVVKAPAILIGHSYGAVVAMAFAQRRPDLALKLVVVEAPLPPSRLEELETFLARKPDEMLDALPEVLRAAVSSGGRRGRKFVEMMRFLALESSLFADLRAANDFSDEDLARIQCPTLAIYGTGSSCRSIGARLERTIPHASLVELAGGHFLPLETPGPLADAIVRYVDG